MISTFVITADAEFNDWASGFENRYATTADTATVLSLIDSSRAAYSHNLELSIEYATRALEKAEEIDYVRGVARARDDLGITYSRMGEADKALEHLEKSLEINKSIREHRGIASNLLNIGSIYKRQSNYDRALEYFFESLRVCEEIGLKNGITANLGNIGLIYHETEDYKRALDYYYRAADINKEIENSYLLSVNYNNIGLTYSDLEEYEKSIDYHIKSLNLKEAVGMTIGMAYSHNNIGKTLYLMGDYEAATESLNKSLELNKGQDPDLESIIHENLARVYLATGQYEPAANHARQSLNLASDFGSKIGEQEAYRLLSEIFSSKGDFRTAMDYHRKLLEVRNRIFDEEKAKNIEELRLAYEAEKQAAEIALLEQMSEQERRTKQALIVTILLIGVIAFLVYNRQKLKILNTRAELENSCLKEKQLEQELKFKNKQLTTISLNLVQKNEIMRELREKIDSIKSSNNGNVEQRLQNLDHLMDYSFSLDEDWKEFKLYFEEVHTEFFDLLKKNYPDLTPRELRLSALIKLNLTIKEIASLSGISPSSVKTARYRLRKKLKLKTGENLTEFMMGIEQRAAEET